MLLNNYAKDWMKDFFYYVAETNDFRIVGKPYSKNNLAISFDDMEYKISEPKPAFTDQIFIEKKEDNINDFSLDSKSYQRCQEKGSK